jgi:phosphatidylglycerol:prolipoprotein diacylglycerol transferase
MTPLIVWDPNPHALVIGDTAIEWYGVLFAVAFLLSQRLVLFFVRREGKVLHGDVTLLIYLVVGVVVGARLFHCLFYDPAYYLSHPLEILQVWKGGLASHGGALGIVIVTFVFSRQHPEHRFLWLLDRIAIVAALFGVLVRLGNFVNSEVIGKETGGPYGVVFARPIHEAVANSSPGVNGVEIMRDGNVEGDGTVPLKLRVSLGSSLTPPDSVRHILINRVAPGLGSDLAAQQQLRPGETSLSFSLSRAGTNYAAETRLRAISRHPVQLYEAVAYFGVFLVLFGLWHRDWKSLADGTLLGLFFVTLFSARFFLEDFKEPIPGLDADLPLRMGQLASLPFVVAGAILLWGTRRKSGG